VNAEGFESELDPDLVARMASDSSQRLYAYSRATGGWFIPAPPGSEVAALGVPYDFTQLAITGSAVYWQGWEQNEVTRKGFLGREKTERTWQKSARSMSVPDIEGVAVSRDGYDPSYASWPREQHLALEVSARNRSQTFYNWSNNSDDVMRDVAAIFSGLGIAVDDRAGVLR
jgi:hypothetical protein